MGVHSQKGTAMNDGVMDDVEAVQIPPNRGKQLIQMDVQIAKRTR